MRKLFSLGVFVFFAVAGAACQGEPSLEREAKVYGTIGGERLEVPRQAVPAATVTQFLKSRGLSNETVRSLRAAEERPGFEGATHLTIEQWVEGLRVFGGYVKATVDNKGDLVQVIDALATVEKNSVAPAKIDEEAALRTALSAVHPKIEVRSEKLGKNGNVTSFAKDKFFYDNPNVEKVAVAGEDGTLDTGFLVETWSLRNNQLHHVLVSGSGKVLKIENRTNSDSYNIFPNSPIHGAQTVVSGPGAGNAQSPIGWLSGAQLSTNISGNNVHAYLDTDNNNAADPGGTAIADGNFLTAHDAGSAPSTAQNRNVAIQNLFYLNNVLHDRLYTAGFIEAAGNFQNDNFGRGGARGADAVDAEGQDGGGTDNANFATPRDGRRPRMQMYLWTGRPSHQVQINAPASIAGVYNASGADFGPQLNGTGLTGDVAAAVDGTAPASDGCEAISGVAGRIALIDRGTCAFTVKVANAQAAGAIGVIIANNQGGDQTITMGGEDATITIPAVMVGQNDGATIRSASGVNANIRASNPPPLFVDGDLDSDIVYHEYGHGLTWRMIGSMSGPMSGAIGEGMSDVLAIIFNGDDVIGEYSFSDPIGIRSEPYANYSRTYGDIVGEQVHFDGEVYGAIGWRLLQNYLAAGHNQDTLLRDLVDGMNYTPSGPSFEHMRDGILQSLAARGATARSCLVWEAFASYGVGVGARARVRGSSVVVTESFTRPSTCP